jgi:ubiquinone/menaquinone biosynthesis C-methylase UbiE
VKRGFEVVSVDISRSYVEKAKNREKNKFSHATFCSCRCPKFAFRNSTFCLVLCSEVLEHLPNYLKGLQEMIRILKSKGALVLSIPSSFSFNEIFLRSKEHLHKINPIQLKKMLKTSGFSLTNEEYCNFAIKPIIDLKPWVVEKYLMLRLWVCLDKLVGKIPFVKLFCWCCVLKAYKDSAGKLKHRV